MREAKWPLGNKYYIGVFFGANFVLTKCPSLIFLRFCSKVEFWNGICGPATKSFGRATWQVWQIKTLETAPRTRLFSPPSEIREGISDKTCRAAEKYKHTENYYFFWFISKSQSDTPNLPSMKLVPRLKHYVIFSLKLKLFTLELLKARHSTCTYGSWISTKPRRFGENHGQS